MERKWFEPTFDKNELRDTKEQKPAPTQEEILAAVEGWYAERIKKFPMNIVEFLVWLWLLIFCWTYIQNNPAEKSSLFNWIDSVVQNIQIKFLQRTQWTWSEILQQKQLVQTFDAIISTAEEFVWCLEERDIVRIRRARETLNWLSVEEFIAQQQSYTTVANIYYSRIQEECINN
jgi:hypothetical protein